MNRGNLMETSISKDIHFSKPSDSHNFCSLRTCLFPSPPASALVYSQFHHQSHQVDQPVQAIQTITATRPLHTNFNIYRRFPSLTTCSMISSFPPIWALASCKKPGTKTVEPPEVGALWSPTSSHPRVCWSSLASPGRETMGTPDFFYGQTMGTKQSKKWSETVKPAGSIYQSIDPSIHESINPSIYQSINLWFYQSINQSIYVYIYIYIYVFIYIYI